LSGVFKQQGNKPVEGVARVAEFIAKQAEEAKRRNTTLNLGDFIVELKFAPGEVRPRGVMNMAELQIVIECDVKETCVYIDTNLVQVRNELTNVFVAIDREEVMSLEGKKRLKKILMERLNMWLPKGRVQSLFFAKFVVA
jgi:flagellar basal body-associated protein FliL